MRSFQGTAQLELDLASRNWRGKAVSASIFKVTSCATICHFSLTSDSKLQDDDIVISTSTSFCKVYCGVLYRLHSSYLQAGSAVNFQSSLVCYDSSN